MKLCNKCQARFDESVDKGLGNYAICRECLKYNFPSNDSIEQLVIFSGGHEFSGLDSKPLNTKVWQPDKKPSLLKIIKWFWRYRVKPFCWMIRHPILYKRYSDGWKAWGKLKD